MGIKNNYIFEEHFTTNFKIKKIKNIQNEVFIYKNNIMHKNIMIHAYSYMIDIILLKLYKENNLFTYSYDYETNFIIKCIKLKMERTILNPSCNWDHYFRELLIIIEFKSSFTLDMIKYAMKYVHNKLNDYIKNDKISKKENKKSVNQTIYLSHLLNICDQSSFMKPINNHIIISRINLNCNKNKIKEKYKSTFNNCPKKIKNSYNLSNYENLYDMENKYYIKPYDDINYENKKKLSVDIDLVQNNSCNTFSNKTKLNNYIYNYNFGSYKDYDFD
jgi:hypothetical protein